MSALRDYPPVEDALTVLDQQLNEVQTVKDWARLHGYARAAFTRAVKTHFGCSAGVLLRAHRLAAVERILREENVKLYDVARRVGLRDAKALNHLVKAQVGLPPRAWREQLQAERRARTEG